MYYSFLRKKIICFFDTFIEFKCIFSRNKYIDNYLSINDLLNNVIENNTF